MGSEIGSKFYFINNSTYLKKGLPLENLLMVLQGPSYLWYQQLGLSMASACSANTRDPSVPRENCGRPSHWKRVLPLGIGLEGCLKYQNAEVDMIK